MIGPPARCVIACVGGGSNAMGIFYPYLADEEVQADRRGSRGRRHRNRAARGVADGGHAGRSARQPHLPAAGRQRPDHRDAFGFGRAWIIPASGPSTRGSRTTAAPSTCRSPTTRRWRRSTTAAASKASFRRWNRATRSRMRRSSRRRCRATRCCSSIFPVAATRTCTPSPSARAQFLLSARVRSGDTMSDRGRAST